MGVDLMKRILLSGYYGFKNTGDEAILAALIAGLKRSYEKVEIIVLSANPKYTKKIHQVKAIRRLDFKKIIWELKTADLLISGGGSLLQDVTSLKNIPYYLTIILLAKIMQTPVFFCAQGVGPITKQLNQKLVAKILNQVNLISVRDETSKQLLEAWGVEQEIEVTADLVFNLSPSPEHVCTKILQQEDINRHQALIGVALRPWKDNSYLEQMLVVLDNLVTKLGVQILLIPFHYPVDRQISQFVAHKMEKQVKLIKGDYSPQEILGLVAECDLMLGVRLHSLIFAVRAGVAVAGISYDPKIDSFLAQLGLEAVADVDDLMPQQVEEEVIKLWPAREEQVAKWINQVKELEKLAALNFSLVQKKLGV